MAYSQRGEEVVILGLEGTGRLLDIGAYDGLTFSNSRALSERGWEGVYVEPSAYAFAALASNPPPRAKLVHAAIGPRTGLCSFQLSRDAVSSTSRAHAHKWSGATTFIPIFTVQVSLMDLLKDFPGPYRFINVDVEGMSMWLFKELTPHLDALETEMVCVEHDGEEVRLSGWRQVYKSEENVILRRK